MQNDVIFFILLVRNNNILSTFGCGLHTRKWLLFRDGFRSRSFEYWIGDCKTQWETNSRKCYWFLMIGGTKKSLDCMKPFWLFVDLDLKDPLKGCGGVWYHSRMVRWVVWKGIEANIMVGMLWFHLTSFWIHFTTIFNFFSTT